MAGARENLQEDKISRSKETESRSIEETKRRAPDLKPSESGRRSDERIVRRRETESRSWVQKKESEDSGLRINEMGYNESDLRETLQKQRLRDRRMRSHETESTMGHNESDLRETLQQQRLRDLRRRSYETESRMGHNESDLRESLQQQRLRDRRMRSQETESIMGHNESNLRETLQQQRLRDRRMRSHETESRIRHHKRDRSPDWRSSEPSPCPNHRSESRWRFDDYRESESEWSFYENELQDRIDMPTCKHFMNGYCKYGSTCVAEPMHQDLRMSGSERWRFDERTQRRHKSQSRFRSEKRVTKLIRDPRERFEDVEDEEHIEMKKREAQENLQEERGARESAQKREAQENLQKREAQENLQEKRSRRGFKSLRELGKEIAKGFLKEKTEKERREAQENLQEEKQRIKPTVQSDEVKRNYQNSCLRGKRATDFKRKLNYKTHQRELSDDSL